LLSSGAPISVGFGNVLPPDDITFAIDEVEIRDVLARGKPAFRYDQLAVFQRSDGTAMHASG